MLTYREVREIKTKLKTMKEEAAMDGEPYQNYYEDPEYAVEDIKYLRKTLKKVLKDYDELLQESTDLA